METEKYVLAEAAKLKVLVETAEAKALENDIGYHTFLDGFITLFDKVIDEMPAADVQEIKRGEWEYKQIDNFRKYKVICPFCKREYVDNYDGYIDAEDFNYCPNCGARMK